MKAGALLFRIVRLLLGASLAVTTVLAGEFEHVEFSGKNFTVCHVDLDREQLELFLRNEKGAPFKSFSSLNASLSSSGRQLVFAMNAGMYHADYSPVGLYIENGRELSPLNLKNGEGNFFLKPNGVFAVTESGAAIVESSRFTSAKLKVLLATQSGPMLVINRQIHPSFSPVSTSSLYRNGVGVASPKEVVFVISEEPVTLYEFALLFRDRLRCANALFLDGTISSLFSEKLSRNDKKIDLGPIIGITRYMQ